MRWRLVTLAFAGLAIATTASGSSSSVARDESSVAPTVAVHRVGVGVPAIRDEAAMVLVGTVLIGLGAIVRRAA